MGVFAWQEFFTGDYLCKNLFFLVQPFVGIFFGKFPSHILAFKIIENDGASFYYRSCSLTVTYTVQVYSYDSQY